MEIDLGRFQRWMSAAIMYQPNATAKQAMKAKDVAEEIPFDEALKFIKPSKTLNQYERLALYRSMYILRLVDVLKIDYPALAEFLGEDDYPEFVDKYLQVHPSRSYNLSFLSYNIPNFIKTAPKIKDRGFLYDLASLELALSYVFDAEETPVLTKEDIAAIAPEIWETAKIIPITAFRLLALKHNANQYLQAVQDEDKKLPKAKKIDSWVAVYRRDYKLWRLPLNRDAYKLLSDIVAGKPLGEAIVSAIENSHEKDVAALQNQVFKWFQDWVSEGFFQKIVVE
ncbi:MAG: putative DNA-binding domain-containing protein [Blastocatellia bacterium]|nr:putative DNA-binding domain-containing protein [Blastocatellia bacterium]MBN8722300.1 putative DNA-binding domain-containing protein [Acidobacteriota bacterium]